MTDYTQLALDAKAPIPHELFDGRPCDCPRCHWIRKVNTLADSLLACQRERDELAVAFEKMRHMAGRMFMHADEYVSWALEEKRAKVATEAERDWLAAEVERLRAKLTCPECGQEIHAAHHLECSHDRS